MIKVLMVSKACYVASYRKKLEELAKLGVDLTLVVPPFWGERPDQIPFEEGNEQGYKIIKEKPVLNGHFHLHFYRNLEEHLASTRPQILHIDEEPYDFVAFHALRQGLRTKTRVLFFSWQNIHKNFPPPLSLMESYVLSRSHGAIAGNSEAALVLRAKGFTGPLFIIPQFGVDTELFRPKEEEASPEQNRPFVIGYAGRLVEEKGVAMLLEGVAKIADPWELWFIGDGPLRDPLEAQARRLGVADRVKMVGTVASYGMPDYLRQLDLLVLPSLTTRRWKEQFGRVLVEAMACGVPVLGSSSGEIPNVIGDSGLVFEEGDILSLKAQIERVMKDKQLRRALSFKGRKRVEEQYTQKRIALKTFQGYQQILA